MLGDLGMPIGYRTSIRALCPLDPNGQRWTPLCSPPEVGMVLGNL
jgi:hypothetical protein